MLKAIERFFDRYYLQFIYLLAAMAILLAAGGMVQAYQDYERLSHYRSCFADDCPPAAGQQP
jgi:hypothetical protein